MLSVAAATRLLHGCLWPAPPTKQQFRACAAGPPRSASMHTRSSTKALAAQEPATTSKSPSVAKRTTRSSTKAQVAQEPATTPDYVRDCALGPGDHDLDVAVNPLQPKKNTGGGDCFFLAVAPSSSLKSARHG